MISKKQELKKSRIEELKEKLAETGNATYRRKLYNLFLSQLDDLSEGYIRKLDKIIDTISNDFMGNGGWCVGRKQITNFTSRIIAPDFTTQRLVRDINGYHVQPVPEQYEKHSSTQAEESFLKNKKIELDILHRAYLMKDDILYNRHYTLKNPAKEGLVEELREFFGYNSPEDTILPPTVQTVEEIPEGPKF